MCQQLSRAIALEAHGYSASKELSSSSSNVVLLVNNPIWPEVRYVAKTFSLGNLTSADQYGVWQEINLLKNLKHPHVIRYVESWWSDGDLCNRRLTVVMDHADNGDLRQACAAVMRHRLRFEERLIKRWLRQMMEGLEYVHSQNVVHRDLKASNIFLKESWRTCVIGDFGIAKVMDASTLAHTIVGTPSYMAPELVKNEPYGSKVDHWAIGVILYELVALKQPFQGSSLAAIMYQIASAEPSREPLLASSCSAALTGLVINLLSKEAPLRPSVAVILADDRLWSNFSMEESESIALQAFDASGVAEGEGTGIDYDSDDDSWAGAQTLASSKLDGTVDVLADAMLGSMVTGSSAAPSMPGHGLRESLSEDSPLASVAASAGGPRDFPTATDISRKEISNPEVMASASLSGVSVTGTTSFGGLVASIPSFSPLSAIMAGGLDTRSDADSATDVAQGKWCRGNGDVRLMSPGKALHLEDVVVSIC